mmetsp:Transcript_25162/g.52246  ORF Transcript_25162/g.52246 Transcript_25162/m.52246 type:complete len:1538 (-) Transcript_25162:37-4650(-)
MAHITRLALVGATAVSSIHASSAAILAPTPVAHESLTTARASPAGPLHSSAHFLDSHETHPNRDVDFSNGFPPSPSDMLAEGLDRDDQEQGRRLEDGRVPRDGRSMTSCQDDSWQPHTWGCMFDDECKYWKDGAWHDKSVGEMSPFFSGGVDHCDEYYLCGTNNGWADCFNTVQVGCITCRDGYTAAFNGKCGSELKVDSCTATQAPTRSPTTSPTLSPTSSQPTRAYCANGQEDEDETDIDCGGSLCDGCDVDKKCNEDSDCLSETCMSNKCVSAPTVSPTQVPTLSPTIAPTLKPTFAPTPALGCDESGCWTGDEPCCDDIQANLFTTSRITKRILFFNSTSFNTYLESQQEEIGRDDEGRVIYRGTLPMNHDGGGYIDFSTGGDYLYFSQRIEEAYLDEQGNSVTGTTGSVEKFHAQLGYRAGTAVNATAAKAKTLDNNFLPSVILVRPIGMFVIDESSNKLLLSRGSDIDIVFRAEKSVCTLRDIAADNSGGDDVTVLILCKDNGKVFETIVSLADGTVTSTPTTPTTEPKTQINTTSPNQTPVSISFDKSNSPEYFFVAVKIDDPTASGTPHVHRFSHATGLLERSLLKLEDVGGGKAPRDGISLEMIRMAPNGFLYVTDSEYGLPMIIDKDDGVIGQTGELFGLAADTFSLAFSTSAYGKWCELTSPGGGQFPDSEVKVEVGKGLEFEITLKNAQQEWVTRHTEMVGEVKNSVCANTNCDQVRESVFALDVNFTKVSGSQNKYRGTMLIETESIEGKWEFHVLLENMRTVLGKSREFELLAGDISSTYTEASVGSINAVAGVNHTIIVDAHDKEGNSINIGGDKSKFEVSVVDFDDSQWNYNIEDRGDGTYHVNVTSERSGLFPVDISLDGSKIKNCPVALAVSPSPKASALSEVQTGPNGDDGDLSLWKAGVDKFLVITPKDEFGNVIEVDSRDNASLSLWESFKLNATLKSTSKEPTTIEFARDTSGDYSGRLAYKYTIEADKIKVDEESDASFLYVEVKCFNESLTFVDSEGSSHPLDGSYKIPPEKMYLRITPHPDTYLYTTMLYGVCLAIIALFGLLAYRWKKEDAIKFSQKRILSLILIGCFLFDAACMITSIKVLDEMEMSCKVQMFVALFGVCLVLLSIIAKSYRVIKLAYNTGHKRMAISDNYLLKRIAAVMFIYCALMITWYLIDNVERQESEQDGLIRYNKDGTRVIPTVESCVWGKPIYNWVISGLTGFLLIGVMFLCFLARKIPSAFNEGKYVFQAVVCSVLMGAVFLVNYLMGVQGFMPDVYLTIFSVTCNLVSLSFVFMIFIPKFKLILSKKELDVSDLTRKIDADRAKSTRNLGRNTDSSVGSTTSTRSTTGVMRGGKGLRQSSSRFAKSPKAVGKGQGSPSSTIGDGGRGVEMTRLERGISRDMSYGTAGFGGPASNNSAVTSNFINPMAGQEGDEKKQLEAAKVVEKRLRDEGAKQKREINKLKSDNERLNRELGNLKKALEEERGREKVSESTAGSIPEGSSWQEFFDEAGNPYYYHTGTQVCQYERPATWL